MRKSTVDAHRLWVFDLSRHDDPEPPAPTPPPVPTPPAPGPPAPTPPAPTPPAPSALPNGFPEGTPLTEMTGDQREAYWKFQSRKHEERVKSFGIKDPAELDQLRQAAAKLAELEDAQRTETERAVSEAEKRGRTEASTEFGQELAKAKFEAVAAGRIPDIDSVVEDLNLAKFVGADGKPDVASITASVERFAALVPAAPTTPPAPRPDPSQGPRPQQPPTDYRTAPREEFEAKLAELGVRPRR